MLTEYVRGAMRKAKYEILGDDGSYYGEIPGFQGVYANAPTLEECRDQLQEVLEGWLLLSISRNLAVPQVDGINLEMSRLRAAHLLGQLKIEDVPAPTTLSL